MIKAIQGFFKQRLRPAEQGVTSRKATEEALRLATAALLIEVTKADATVKKEEREMVAAAVQKTFGISDKETSELIAMAKQEVKESHSFYQFTGLINKGFSYDEKKNVVELLWRVVFADAEMEMHEEHLVRRLSGLLHVEHKDFIKAKQAARAHARRTAAP
ncbi:MAG: hypothetical protein BMS9Abin24_090 [Thermodesulfobacteriota bacterium]|nr:MAG: hypothetical protein BMS9Abin24_090 [Thermodesulfobacteriota bacterium]